MSEDIEKYREDMARMELLYKKFYRKLYLYAQTFLGNEDESKDIVADVFQMIWEDWQEDAGRFSNPTGAFFYTTVRNRCLDSLRHTQASEHYADLLRATAPLMTDERVMEYERRITQLHEAVLALPEPSQSVLRCVYYRKFSYKKAAEHLGMSENMVHKHMLKVFRLLRENIRHSDALLSLLISVWHLCS